MRIHPQGSGQLINHVEHLHAFLRAWDTAPAGEVQAVGEEEAPHQVLRSAYGNINRAGSPYCLAAAIYTPSHPDFIASIEPGVLDLVALLTYRLNCITYSSCEGHYSDGDHFYLRYVSIIPRDAEEGVRLAKALTVLCTKVAALANESANVLPVVEVVKVTSDDGPTLEGIDVTFRSLTADSTIYFKHLECPYLLLCKALTIFPVERHG